MRRAISFCRPFNSRAFLSYSSCVILRLEDNLNLIRSPLGIPRRFNQEATCSSPPLGFPGVGGAVHKIPREGRPFDPVDGPKIPSSLFTGGYHPGSGSIGPTPGDLPRLSISAILKRPAASPE